MRRVSRFAIATAAGAASLIMATACARTPAAAPATEALAAAPVQPVPPEAITLVHEAYRIISGPAGEERDWGAFRRLFAPGARLAAMVPPENMPDSIAAGSRPAMMVLSVEDYIRRAGPSLERGGFFEHELGHVSERYGRVAHVFSSYVSRVGSADSEPIDYGVNSFQLVEGDGRWWIFTILWDSQSRGAGEVPERYR